MLTPYQFHATKMRRKINLAQLSDDINVLFIRRNNKFIYAFEEDDYDSECSSNQLSFYKKAYVV